MINNDLILCFDAMLPDVLTQLMGNFLNRANVQRSSSEFTESQQNKSPRTFLRILFSVTKNSFSLITTDYIDLAY